MVSDSIICVCGGRIGLDWWEVFAHAICEAPRPPAPPAPPARSPAVQRERRRVYGLLTELKDISRRQHRYRPRRRR